MLLFSVFRKGAEFGPLVRGDELVLTLADFVRLDSTLEEFRVVVMVVPDVDESVILEVEPLTEEGLQGLVDEVDQRGFVEEWQQEISDMAGDLLMSEELAALLPPFRVPVARWYWQGRRSARRFKRESA